MVASFASGFGNINQQAGFTGRSRGAGQNRSETLIESLRAAAETLLSASRDEASKGKADDFLKDLEESVQVASSLKDAAESQKDSERGQKISRLKERIEQLKERLKYATPEQARALAQELKRLGKEFKLAAASLSDGGSATQAVGAASLAQLSAAVPAGGETALNAAGPAATGALTATEGTPDITTARREPVAPATVEPDPSGSEGQTTAAGVQDDGQAGASSEAQSGDRESSSDNQALDAAIHAYTSAIASAQGQGGYDGNSVKKKQAEELRKIEQDLKAIAARIKALAKRDDEDAKKELKAAEKELRKGSEELDKFQRQQQSANGAAQVPQNPTSASDTTTAQAPSAADAGSSAANVSIDAGIPANLATVQISIPANVIV